MSSTGIFWIREDFRIENNPALSFATQNHDNVIALYIYNNNDFDNKREAQKWWVYKSLETLKKELAIVKPSHIVSFIGRTHGKIGDKV